MAKKTDKPQGQSDSYTHEYEAVQRPEVGVQAEFSGVREPKKYRYDSSLAPELCWDENAEREFAEWLLNLIAEAAEKGEANIFSTSQQWVGTDESFNSIGQCAARLKSLTQPFLNWTGKAERQQISVPTIPLFIHERHSTQAILKTLESYKASGTTMDLFGDPDLDIADKLDAYEHTGPWNNRLILGDSLQVMNSLLEYEGLGGQVKTIFIDPPYGIKFGSNFQPFVRKNKVVHGRDDEMIREPEMVRAYRDTWELGIHSFLTYLKDRFNLAKELLAQDGSVFVQISDENLHHVKQLLDEVFGTNNFIALIPFRKKTMPLGATYIEQMQDFILWYGKEKGSTKYHQLYTKQNVEGDFHWQWFETAEGEFKKMTKEENNAHTLLPEFSKIYRLVSMWPPSFSETSVFPVEFNGEKCMPAPGACWPTNIEGMNKLVNAGRLQKEGRFLRYKLYLSDYDLMKITTPWNDTVGARNKAYVVQTAEEVIKRCILMTTDPGDLVLDPTCGSGTTAVVSESLGRRWITCDTSRVPLALARQRLLTATFPWYELKDPQRGPSTGFVYKRKQNKKGEEVGGLVPRITLKSIANNDEPETVTLVDKPEINKTTTRVCGPFTVEATIQAAGSLLEEQNAIREHAVVHDDPRLYIDRMIEVLRKSQSLSLPGNKKLELENVRPLSAEDFEFLHAEAVEENGAEKRIAIVFGPQEGAINSDMVFNSASEARFLKFDALYFFGFAIQAKAREMVSDRNKLRLPCTYVAVTPDVVMSDLLKTSKSDQIFSITGLPDIDFVKSKEKADNGDALYQVSLMGLDVFTPHNMETESIEADNLPCWMLDTDYNGMSFCARQVFFPKTSAWDNLQKSLKGRFDDSVWEHLAGTTSEPFLLGKYKTIAVKVIDERGNELMVVRKAAEAN